MQQNTHLHTKHTLHRYECIQEILITNFEEVSVFFFKSPVAALATDQTK